MTSEEALAARAASGDEVALSTLITRCYDDCWRFAFRMLGDAADAEDAVQETFLRVARAIPRYEARERFRAWLFRILANRCRTAASARRQRQSRLVFDDGLTARATVEPVEPSDERLSRALAELAPHLREAFLMKYGEELEYEEMARILEVGVSALKMRVSRARELLRAALGHVAR